jgi:hypothetical protein
MLNRQTNPMDLSVGHLNVKYLETRVDRRISETQEPGEKLKEVAQSIFHSCGDQGFLFVCLFVLTWVKI